MTELAVELKMDIETILRWPMIKIMHYAAFYEEKARRDNASQRKAEAAQKRK